MDERQGTGPERNAVHRFVARHGARGVPGAVARSVNRRLRPSRGRPEPLDLTRTTTDPADALRLGAGRLPLIRIAIDQVRSYSLTVPIGDANQHPFTATAAALHDAPDQRYEGSPLQRFYESWQPADLGAVYGEADGGGALSAPPTPDCLPWMQGANPVDVRRSRAAHEARLRARWGPAEGSPGAVERGRGRPPVHGYRSFGPVSSAAAHHYFEDYRRLTASIVERGYVLGLDDHPTVQVLRHEERWIARLLGGNHRVAVLAALGHRSVVAGVVGPIVDRSSTARWPGVRSGLYRIDQAERVFDRFLQGAAPPGFPRFGVEAG